MATIDKFIEALHRLRADHLEVTPGARIAVALNGAQRPVSSQPAMPDQVQQILQEILPADSASLEPDGEHEFVYTAPTGAVRVSVNRENGSPRLLIQPLNGDGDSPEGSNGKGGTDSDSESLEQPVADSIQPIAVDVASGAISRAKIESLFRRMVEEGCSDLHISTGVSPVFRKDGSIVVIEDLPPLSPDATRQMLFSITPQQRQEEFERLHDTDFAYEISGVARFRCNLFMDRMGMGGAFRVIPAKIMTVEDLGLLPEIVELCKLQSGLVLVTGPTGSGKSTTLAAMVDYINESRSDHIITVEDPIEFVHPNKKCLINQREIGIHTQGFKVALRAALREDPDIVLVGEMRDLETVAIAIETAETGHLVFGTLHTRTASSTVDRIIDQFPAEQQSQIRTMLAESLRGVISQTLLKAKGGGRVAAMEFLKVNTAISNLIREGKTFQIPSIMQTSKGDGMQTLGFALFNLVKAGRIEPDIAYAAAADKSEIKSLFANNGIVFESE
jgi:twitching motility protein PilT